MTASVATWLRAWARAFPTPALERVLRSPCSTRPRFFRVAPFGSFIPIPQAIRAPAKLTSPRGDPGELRVTAQLDERQAQRVLPGQRATVTSGGRRAQGAVSAVDNDEVVVELHEANATMQTGAAVVEIQLPPRSLVQRLK
jgi:hypothetical protein